MRLCNPLRSTFLKDDGYFAVSIHWILNALLVYSFLVHLLISPALGQQKASDQADYLRTHVSQIEAAYATALIAPEQGVAARVRVDQLRADLREKFKHLVQKATSSEATLAILRADADATLEAIGVYEKTLAAGPGETTTLWNVLPGSDLEEMYKRASTRLESLEAERHKTPDWLVPSSLEFRIREVRGWVDRLKAEIVRRGSVKNQVRLKPIRGDLTVEEARAKYPAIGAADGGEHFQRRLDYQIQLRLHSAPQDAALKTLEAAVPRMKPRSLPPSVSRGPPASFQDAEQQLRSGHLEELSAVTLRDPIAIAKARARSAVCRQWVALVYGDLPETDRLGFSATSTEHLVELRGRWSDWRQRLERELQTRPDDSSVEAQLKEASARIRDLDGILEDRLLPRPPDNPGDFAGHADDHLPQPPGSKARALERAWDRQIAYLETVELLRASNQFSTVPMPDIDEAIGAAIRNRILAEARSLRSAYDDATRIQRDLFISGRGPETAEAGRHLQAARDSIRVAAGTLLNALPKPKSGSGEVLHQASELQEARELLAGFARQSGASPSTGYGQALAALENASDLLKTSAQGGRMEIQAARRDGAQTDSEYRIQLKPKEGLPPQLKLKLPSEYSDLYPKSGPRKTVKDFLTDPQRAPGGVIVDALLPEAAAIRIESLNVATDTGLVEVKVGGSWLPLKQRPDPVLARLAWAFVLDDRSALIDLRPPEPEEALSLAMQYGNRRISSADMGALSQEFRALTSVNVNNALRDTVLAQNLIAADHLMFDLLPLETVMVERQNRWPELPLDELRLAFQADAAAELNQAESRNILFKKSILTISSSTCEIGRELSITPQLAFHLFGVPNKGDRTLPLKASERWFNVHQRELSHLPQLFQLTEFAALVALFRSVRDHQVEHNLDDLIVVSVPVVTTPRFIMRGDRIDTERWRRLRALLVAKEN